jgi:hypothetical protein
MKETKWKKIKHNNGDEREKNWKIESIKAFCWII